MEATVKPFQLRILHVTTWVAWRRYWMKEANPWMLGCLLLISLVPGCNGWKERARLDSLPTTSTSSENNAKPLPKVTFDEQGPRYDLAASHSLFHLYRPTFVLPIAAEGVLKYTQQYTSPWRNIIRLQNHPARQLITQSATLRFAWEYSGQAILVVRLEGDSAGKRLSVVVNGRVYKNTQLETGWQEVHVKLPTGALIKGENTLMLSTAKKGAFIHSVEFVPESIPVPTDWPRLSPAGNAPTALAAWPKLRRHLEVPNHGWFAVATASSEHPGRFRVTVTTEDNTKTVLLDEVQPAKTVRDHQLSLAAFAGQLVALDLESTGFEIGEAEWRMPRILLPMQEVTSSRVPHFKNVILFVADALRADRLPMYAKTRVQTPNIAKAADKMGVTFLSALAASPSSPPSHASIQSGVMPRQHGILGDKSKPIPGTPMISALVEAAGIKAGFIGDAGFAMNRLKPLSSWTMYHQPNSEGKGADCAAVINGILDFAEAQRSTGKRFFVSAVAFEAHTAYLYHPGKTEHYFSGPFDPLIGKKPDGIVLTAIVNRKLPMTPERWAQIKGLYDGEVEHLDGCFGELLDGLVKQGIEKETAILLVADHGEGFFEHKSMGHAYGHYAELTHVPMVLFLPGISKAQSIPTVVSHVDLVPTILDLMGLPTDLRVQGESLLPLISRGGSGMPQVMPSEYGRSYSLRSRNLHYLVNYSGEESLYDMAADPEQTKDVLALRPMALGYFRELAGVYLGTRTRWKNHKHGTLNNPRRGWDEAMEAR